MTDYISRADAIEMAVDVETPQGTYERAIYVDDLMALPSADAVSRVDGTNAPDRLDDVSADAVQGEWNIGKPTKGGKYIVTLIGIGNYRFVDIMHYDKPCMPNIEVSGACWYRDDVEWGDVVYDDKDIIAWMPLPTPYKGGDDE